jgi:hypothetical protein
MKQAIRYLVWLTVVVGIGAAVFAPQIGLIHGSPLSAVAAVLFGSAMIVETRRRACAAR